MQTASGKGAKGIASVGGVVTFTVANKAENQFARSQPRLPKADYMNRHLANFCKSLDKGRPNKSCMCVR